MVPRVLQSIKHPFIKSSLFVILGSVGLYALVMKFVVSNIPTTEWIQINVTPKTLQADAHLIKFPDGTAIMIDVGDPDNELVPFLKKKRVRYLTKVIISHMHKDHYGGLLNMIRSGIRPKEVYLNIPPKDICDKEIPWGCDYGHIQEFLATLQNENIPVLPIKQGDIYYEDKTAALKVLYAYLGKNTPIGETDVNDMSVILKLSHQGVDALFTGDLNFRLGEYLANNVTDLKAQILKVPHHAAESVAPDIFFDAVAAKVAMVPAPKELWLENPRTQRVRKYLSDHKIETFISGIDGSVRIVFKNNHYVIKRLN